MEQSRAAATTEPCAASTETCAATTAEGILAAYLTRNHLRVSGSVRPIDVLLPMLFMDVCYTRFVDLMGNYKFIHAEKRYATLVRKAIAAYFGEFWRIWNDDEKFAITDIMDAFTAHINNHIYILEAVVWRKFDKFNDADREALSQIMLCNVLSQSAAFVHKTFYGSPNKSIETVVSYTQRLLFAIGDKSRVLASNIDLNTYKDVEDAVMTLINHISKFRP